MDEKLSDNILDSDTAAGVGDAGTDNTRDTGCVGVTGDVSGKAGILANHVVVLGVTGGIAAYKAAVVCSHLVKLGADVQVVMTHNAEHFVGRLTFSTLSGRRVYTDLFEAEQAYEADHITLTDSAEIIVVAPATANIIGKAANGICDDMLSTLLISADCKVLMAPAMNTRMWTNHAVQRNINQLQQWGYYFVGPAEGRLACGSQGKGRMSEPEDIVRSVVELLCRK